MTESTIELLTKESILDFSKTQIEALSQATSAPLSKSTKDLEAQAILQFKKQLQDATLNTERNTEIIENRINLMHTAIAQCKAEKEETKQRLKKIFLDIDEQKDIFERKMSSMEKKYFELEGTLKGKIAVYAKQLNQLRDAQNQKHLLEEETLKMNELMNEEKNQRNSELAAMQRKLVAQRDYYITKLTEKIGEDGTSDLRLDMVTNRIQNQIEDHREELKNVNSLTQDVIKRNNQLRHQLQDLEQKNKALSINENALTNQSVELKNKVSDIKKENRRI